MVQRLTLAGGLALSGLMLFAAAWPLRAAEAGSAVQPIRFGILPIGSASESREQWRPFLDDMARRLGRPVVAVSVGNYEGLTDVVGEQRVDVAFLSGRLAVAAVSRQHMRVIVQFVRGDGARGYIGMLIVRAGGPIHDLHDLLARPGHWRYARDERLSVSGYLAPEVELFAPRGLDSDTFFASVAVSNHQNNALAVANGEADVATSNTPDLDLFHQHFPRDAAKLQVIWRSHLIPAAVLVVRDGVDDALRRQLVAFVTGYGKTPGAQGERERANLARIPDLGGLVTADNRVLQPFVDMDFALLREQAAHAHWVSEQAKQARMMQIEHDYRQATKALQGH